MPGLLAGITRQVPLTIDETWSDYYIRIRSALLINVSVTTYVFFESIVVRRLGYYVADFRVGLDLAIGFYSSLLLFWILNEYNYRKRKFTPEFHFYAIGVSIYLANIIAITDLIHLTGGASSMYPFLYVFLAMIGSFIAPQWFVMPLALLGMVMHGGILWLEATGVLVSYPPGVFSLSAGFGKEIGSIVVVGLFSVVTLIGMFFGQWLYRIFESQRQELVQARINLEEKVEHRTKDLTAAMEKIRTTYQSLDLEKQRQERFFAHVTHQFRTPIHVINNFVSNFFNGVYGSISHRQTEALNHLSMCSQNLLNLVNNLLDMSKIRSGKMSVRRQSHNLPEQMEKITKFLLPFSEAKQVPVIVEIESDVSDKIWTDWVKLEAILTNLLHNAIKFSKGSPVNLGISKEPSDEKLIFRVEDFGRGIPPDAHERIFEAFEQHKPTTETRGSGLGLYISRTFAELMDGELTFRPKQGAGSIFDLLLPYQTEGSGISSDSGKGVSDEQ